MKTGQIYEPIKSQNNVIYSDGVLYFDDYIYFIQLDFNDRVLTLYKYAPGKKLNKEFECVFDELRLYNPHLVPGEKGPYIVGEERKDEKITEVGFYPEKFRAKRTESDDELCLVKDHRLYFDTSVDKYDKARHFVDFYDEIIVKDFEGQEIKREKGSLKLLPDGTWWII